MKIEKLLSKDPLWISKALTTVERDPIAGKELIDSLPEREYHVIGVTGSPGAGKSTLVDRLATELSSDHSVAVIAIDPSSPFTGGAILGDRIRMRHALENDKIFVRSMASRGKVGGLSPAIYDAVKLLGKCGFEKIIVETVGAGQSETDIVNLADIVLLILAPGIGDEIQMLKAGIMEIGDIYVVNKMDVDGAASLVNKIKAMLAFSDRKKEVILTNAVSGKNVDKLCALVEKELSKLIETGLIHKKRAHRERFHKLNSICEIIQERFLEDEKLDTLLEFIKNFDRGEEA
ncbi:methylmalonyl Co-A mutase-associated GTPase MeaB [Kosmotoga sp. DU53]|jgi:LAO/AO transport system kinase|uniref:methylmalonyl Co-A mutase-associated GTPase MeaB n=1 Tax=Kosmotoga sp. DU53 TaxID=1310160 RepID=UPI0007C4BFFE|nr:methylmalonyl Co-A mutase-associated GTPase MeaB [Kosmotoga sp. DU53]MDK2954131.1 GTPase [Kosmotoga sp.]OAA20502.1 transporter [Kosmotoga sp. DU53]